MQKFKKRYKRHELGYIVGSLSEEMVKILGANTKEVIFSEVSIRKNMEHHKDLSEDDYLLLEDIIGKSHLVAKDGKKTVAIAIYMNEMYHYALKATKSGKAIFLTSFRKIKQKDIQRIRRKANQGSVEIIKDFMP